LAEEVLSRGITQLVHSKQIFPITGPRGLELLFHVLYSYDIFVFAVGIIDLQGL